MSALPQASNRIALLATQGYSTAAILRALATELPEARIFVFHENKQSRGQLVRRRVKKLGLLRVLGQLAFLGSLQPVLARAARRRKQVLRSQIEAAYPVVPNVEVLRVDSVNNAATRSALRELEPDVVVVSGTRIISTATLRSVTAPFINMHAGITPAYRGAHGGYWALAEGRRDLVGTTIHFVDAGIDTGDNIEQVYFTPTSADNFATYPLLHLQAGLPALVRAVRASLAGELATQPPRNLSSMLRYHPTLWTYVWCRMKQGVR